MARAELGLGELPLGGLEPLTSVSTHPCPGAGGFEFFPLYQARRPWLAFAEQTHPAIGGDITHCMLPRASQGGPEKLAHLGDSKGPALGYPAASVYSSLALALRRKGQPTQSMLSTKVGGAAAAGSHLMSRSCSRQRAAGGLRSMWADQTWESCVCVSS